MKKFDPFNSRLCRDIRNALSESCVDALTTKNLQPANSIATHYHEIGAEKYCLNYIDNRLASYNKVIQFVTSKPDAEVYEITLHLWDEELFFELHEFLEQHWMKATGDYKKILQALIRAAGTYIHLEQGNMKGAKKMAAKAVEILQPHQHDLPSYFKVPVLLEKLRTIDPVPPKLL